MGVNGAWAFLQYNDIKGTRRDRLGSFKFEEKIYVDVVGTFYDILKKHFWLCDDEDNEGSLAIAAKRSLYEISTIINKHKYILCIDGERTLERRKGHQQRLQLKLNTQANISNALDKFLDKRIKKKGDCNKLMYLSKKLFRFSENATKAFVQLCRKTGWEVMIGDGEAEVAVGRLGGIVVTQDSDLLFYPKIKVVIKPLNEGGYVLYEKDDILSVLGITNEVWTTLGILADNDYDSDNFLPKGLYNSDRHRKTLYADQFEDNYNRMLECLDTIVNKTIPVTTAELVQEYIQAFLTLMNKQEVKEIQFDAYRNSYRIFVLQKEEITKDEHMLNKLITLEPRHIIKKILDSDAEWKPNYLLKSL
ncbi:uncharacterized protein BX663DRAFT_508798 [Cokeromyces recurvatus]|uniref:uncharacterized protein n=1 Tax=Cokeromyces recurvatus TaxID=90255 RepID=UPI0022207E18|nr:uncharacterized protein BX663DRAFT_508798 [Cokeromyces recurvatus]KAI7902897.1 hypothetical protein BX663DRAFT_508798 [Cokeromyces recurvatus]